MGKIKSISLILNLILYFFIVVIALIPQNMEPNFYVINFKRLANLIFYLGVDDLLATFIFKIFMVIYFFCCFVYIFSALIRKNFSSFFIHAGVCAIIVAFWISKLFYFEKVYVLSLKQPALIPEWRHIKLMRRYQKIDREMKRMVAGKTFDKRDLVKLKKFHNLLKNIENETLKIPYKYYFIVEKKLLNGYLISFYEKGKVLSRGIIYYNSFVKWKNYYFYLVKNLGDGKFIIKLSVDPGYYIAVSGYIIILLGFILFLIKDSGVVRV